MNHNRNPALGNMVYDWHAAKHRNTGDDLHPDADSAMFEPVPERRPVARVMVKPILKPGGTFAKRPQRDQQERRRRHYRYKGADYSQRRTEATERQIDQSNGFLQHAGLICVLVPV